jgi:serine/threonine-protein kinase
MPVDSRHCDEKQLARFLAGALSPDAQGELELHLDVCESCQRQLDDSAADATTWQSASAFLHDEPIDMESLSMMLTRGDNAELTRHVADDGVRRVIELLAPTDDPQMLGRIGGYEVAGVIGSGGNGIVLKGHDRALNRYVAIKVLAPHLASSGAARQRFAREAQAAAAVVHENVIAIHGVDESDGLPYLVMPYERGASLQRRIDQDGPLGLIEILRIGMQTASGLAAAHAQGLVHRDIKPANILLADGVERVTITDFGLARAVDDASMTRSGIIAGTPQFMSPEQARGEAVDHRSDLFSLGSLLYALCTGHPPFRSETSYGMLQRICESKPRPIRESNPEIPQWLCRLIDKLNAKEPDKRFQSAAEVAEMLSQCLAYVQQPDAQPMPVALRKERAVERPERRGVWTAGAATVLVTLIALAAVVFRQGRGGDAPSADSPAAIQPATNAAGAASTSHDYDLNWVDHVAKTILEVEDEVEQLEQRAKQLLPVSGADTGTSEERGTLK